MPTNPLLATERLPQFSAIRHEHIEPAVRDVLARNREAVEVLLAEADDRGTAFDADVLALENLADRLHHVWSPVNHLHGVVNSPELRAAYNACLTELSRYQTDMSQDERLYRLYKSVADGLAEDTPADPPAAERLLHLALRDFHLAGVDLPAEQKQRFKAVMEDLSQLQAKFEQNVLDSAAAWRHVETEAARVAGIPATVLEQAAENAREAGETGWLFNLDQPTYVAITTHADDRDLRHLVYRAWVTRASEQAEQTGADGETFDNTDTIERILALRHEAAGLVGFENFAAYSLASKMADSVSDVREFLEHLSDASHATAREELEDLERFAGRQLEAWDIAYYAEKLRHDRFSVSDEQLRPYFPLEKVLAGMFSVVGRLYGVSVERVEDVDAWHPDVRLYRVLGEGGEEIGAFYTDLFARGNKRSGAWMDECVIR
ncbi:MAG: M3 family metallopeptidase, partial [Gammaproteobacteria bacterium]